jgi:hypothetical protein
MAADKFYVLSFELFGKRCRVSGQSWDHFGKADRQVAFPFFGTHASRRKLNTFREALRCKYSSGLENLTQTFRNYLFLGCTCQSEDLFVIRRRLVYVLSAMSG